MQSAKPINKDKILAVDDQPGNLIALEAVLNTDYELVLANSGVEALAILEQRHDFAVILMDLQMPVIDGFETAARIKQMKDCQDIPIIFITAIYKEDPFVKKGYAVGGVDYFSKPFDPEILKLKVGIYASFRHKTAVLKERERQIKDSEEIFKAGRKLTSLLESLPVGIIIADVLGRVCQINDQVSRIWKSVEPIEADSYGQMLGWWDSSGQMIKEKSGPLYRAIHDGKDSHNEEIKIRCLDQSTKLIVVSASPLFGLDRRNVGAVVIIQDVTEPKKIQLDFEQRITKIVSLGLELEQSANLPGSLI